MRLNSSGDLSGNSVGYRSLLLLLANIGDDNSSNSIGSFVSNCQLTQVAADDDAVAADGRVPDQRPRARVLRVAHTREKPKIHSIL